MVLDAERVEAMVQEWVERKERKERWMELLE